MNSIQEAFGTWYEPMKEFLHSQQMYNISQQLMQERKECVVIPSEGSELFFKVFQVTDYNSLKVIVLGQDPYSNPINAYDGLAFSNSTLSKAQPSLSNILEEVENDVYDGFALERVANFSLFGWAEQGVLLLNTALSVRWNQPESHLHIWYPFTKAVVEAINKKEDIVWMLWGNKAANYKKLITNPSHAIIVSGHPSPLNTANPYRGCKCFSKCNFELQVRNKNNIIW